MIATRRGLAVLLALALVLVLALVRDAWRTTAVPDRALAAGIDVEQVTRLRWERAGAPAIELTRGRDASWRWTRPFEASADPAVVASVLDTVRAARWHRRQAAAAAGAVTTRLTLGADERVLRTLQLGAALAGAEQAWIVDGGHALLVDRWVARALDPEPVSLLVTRPFAAVADAAVLEVGDLRLEGQPRRRVGPAPFVVDATAVSELERAVAGLTITGLAPSAVPGAPILAIDLGTVRGRVSEGCGAPDLLRLDASTGPGCVPRVAVDALRAARARLADRPIEELVDPRPAPLGVATITLPDGARLDLVKAPQLDGEPADPTRVAELLAVLAAPVPRSELRRGVTARPAATITVADAAGTTIVLELIGPQLVRRAGEPIALHLTAAAWSVLTRPARELRDPSLWIEEATSIVRISIDGVTYDRGAVIGEWIRTPSGPADPQAVEALVSELAAPRSAGRGRAFARGRRVTITIAPPGGAAIERTLALGAPTREGCPARAGGDDVILPARVCTTAAALAR